VILDVDISVAIGSFRLEATFRAGRGITALFGPSGAGKSLTLRSIAGLIRPSRGRIGFDGVPLFDASASIDLPVRHRRIGYVFQQYALFPHLSVGGNLAFGIPDLPRDVRRERVTRLLALVGLEGFEERRPGQLSGGQQQRVAIARALATEPSLLLLDEPFAAVDLRARRRLREELRRIQEATGTPMILVTHDLAEVRQLSDTLVLLDAGRVVASGPTEALLTPPLPREIEEIVAG
jgi:molybdate transport system ATP-binding protein